MYVFITRNSVISSAGNSSPGLVQPGRDLNKATDKQRECATRGTRCKPVSIRENELLRSCELWHNYTHLASVHLTHAIMHTYACIRTRACSSLVSRHTAIATGPVSEDMLPKRAQIPDGRVPAKSSSAAYRSYAFVSSNA